MNIQASPTGASSVTAPPAPRTLADTGLSVVMMRDILLKTMFRTNLDQVSAIAVAVSLPVNLTQDLVDQARSQKLLEATGTMHATAGNEMGYQLTDAGKARALDALSQSEYYGAMPVPLASYSEQVKRQSVRDIKLSRQQLMSGMGLARYVSEGSLALESYKEYIELFAHSLKQTMSDGEGVAFLMDACGFKVAKDDINLTPETRWKVKR